MDLLGTTKPRHSFEELPQVVVI